MMSTADREAGLKTAQRKQRELRLGGVLICMLLSVCLGAYGHKYVYEELTPVIRVDVDTLLQSIEIPERQAGLYRMFPLRVGRPHVFYGYRSVRPPRVNMPEFRLQMLITPDSVAEMPALVPADSIVVEDIITMLPDSVTAERVDVIDISESLPDWFVVAMRSERLNHDLEYRYMLSNLTKIDYAAWTVPPPPRLPDEDYSYEAMLRNLHLPPVDIDDAILPEFEPRRYNWLHKFGVGLHVAQAYVSSNWYQGGNSYFSLLFNFNWDVELNTVFHPNLMFVSNLSYKLGINTNPRGSLHRYSVSQDQFQYNLKGGFKAWQKWFYSLTTLLKTQFFTAYPADSETPTAMFMSPVDFNLGLGMTYSTTGRNNTLKFSTSISPLSYNLKACVSDRIDRSQFNISPGKRTHSEFGSSAEVTLDWAIIPNISWKSRVFLFTNYHNCQADWENTFNFTINKFLSTQVYVYPRYDTSSEFVSSSWHHFMLKEILSIGVTYTFSTKPE